MTAAPAPGPGLRHDAGAVARLVADLVAIDSVNPALVPGGAGEAEIAAFVAAWLREAGLEVVVDEPVAGRPSVVAVAPRPRARSCSAPTSTRSASRG